MGLAAPKNRTKLGADPRNTFWSSSTTRFGHRYLSAQGWTPGLTLGDTSSAYHQAGHVTAASATGVKIVLKDDTLGIGAKVGAQHDEATGLLELQGLLGRLNGNDAQVKAVEREGERRRQEWMGNRFGLRFVKGETWTSDFAKGEFLGRKELQENAETNETGQKRKRDRETGKDRGKKAKKTNSKEKKECGRAASATPCDNEAVAEEETTEKHQKKSKSKGKKDKKERREKSASTTPGNDIAAQPSVDESMEPKNPKAKSKKQKRDKSATLTPASEAEPAATSSAPSTTSDSAKRKRRKTTEDDDSSRNNKRAAKEAQRQEKKERKERKLAKKLAKKAAAEAASSSSSEESDSEQTTGTRTGTSTPLSGTATPLGFTGRQALRNRYITAKRSALLDAKAMNEILMIKA